jgi:hypothetical protein
MEITLTNGMESLLLATAALRIQGYNVYPALAVRPGPDNKEQYCPIMAIIDMTKERPLTTFALLRFHPSMGSIDIISDQAMLGLTHVMRAETRIKHLSILRLEASQGKTTIGLDEIKSRLHGIAESLYECHKIWPGCRFIEDALAFLSHSSLVATEAIKSFETQTMLEQKGLNLLSMGAEAYAAMARQIQLESRRIASSFHETVMQKLSELIEYNK